jgi:hypothetical protein
MRIQGLKVRSIKRIDKVESVIDNNIQQIAYYLNIISINNSINYLIEES